MSQSPVAPAGIPLCKPYLSEEEQQAVADVLRSGWLMQGSKVAEFERLIADYVGVKYAVAVNSGTSALTLALAAAGLLPGDEVITPSHSFVATANCSLHLGCEPVFVDIAPDDYNIAPSRIRAAINKRTRAIMVVHQIGIPADMDAVMSIAKEHDLIVIEDAACSLGSRYRGRMTGSFGDAACFSFHPRKIITTGEGGMVVTDSADIAEYVRSARNHGLRQSNTCRAPEYDKIGFNYRLTDIQAAIGIIQFHKIEEIINARTRLAARYDRAISDMPELKLPKQAAGMVPNYQSYVVEVVHTALNRDAMIEHMKKRDVHCRPGIQPIHLEPLYARHASAHLPETLRAARRSFFLPLYPSMTTQEQDHVIRSLKEAVRECLAGKESR